MKTKEELLKPRYKVIADYPNSPFRLGDVLYFNDKLSILTYQPNTDFPHYVDAPKYPEIFEPLEWWQDRNPDELPEYLRVTEDGEICKVTRYSLDFPYPAFYTGEIEKKGKLKGRETPFNIRACVPATEQEYIEYTNNH